jgi:hypothetical protein
MTTTSELRSKLEAKGEEVSRIAHKIEDRIDQYKDWQGTVRQYPFQSIGVALGLGLLLSGAATPILKAVSREAGGVMSTLVKSSLTAAVANSIAPKAQQAI